MGGPMAGHLVTHGHAPTVWNRTRTKETEWIAKGAQRCADLADLARRCKVICICVRGTEDVEAVLAEMTPYAAKGTLFIDHSTIAPKPTVDLHEQLVGQGFRFLDAPITGGSMGAQNGTLTIFVGGSAADFAEAEPILAAYGKRVAHVGGPGAGQLTKVANQIAVAGALLGLCESMAFAERAGLDLALTRELLAGGAAGSWAFENYGPRILNRDWTPGFSIDNQRKDLAYAMEAAKAAGMVLPGTMVVDQLLSFLTHSGRGGDTTAAMFDACLQVEAVVE